MKLIPEYFAFLVLLYNNCFAFDRTENATKNCSKKKKNWDIKIEKYWIVITLEHLLYFDLLSSLEYKSYVDPTIINKQITMKKNLETVRLIM